MESEFIKFVKNPKNNRTIDETLTFVFTFIVKIIKVALGYSLNYINYFILSGLFLIYSIIFISGIMFYDKSGELLFSIFEFLSIFFPNFKEGSEIPISVVTQILFLVSSFITLFILVIKFIIKKIFKISIEISFIKELLIKFIINTIIWLTLLIISLYVNMGNGVFAFYIITDILIILAMILGHLSKVILKSTTKTIEVSVVQ
jgi:hypothetical protein